MHFFLKVRDSNLSVHMIVLSYETWVSELRDFMGKWCTCMYIVPSWKSLTLKKFTMPEAKVIYYKRSVKRDNSNQLVLIWNNQLKSSHKW